MARTGGEQTRKRILAVAEELFSNKGFDATSVDEIARTAEVNKALIYYHFKNKNDLIVSLFRSIIEEVEEHVGYQHHGDSLDANDVMKEKVREEIEFLARRKPIITLMLSEALRSNECEDFLFRCAELVIRNEHGAESGGNESGMDERVSQKHLAYEFFTGFIPMVAFIILSDKYCTYFHHAKDRIVDDFVEAFVRSHVMPKLEQE